MTTALKTALDHIEHMAAWISKHHPAGYSFESLEEDMPGMRAALDNQREIELNLKARQRVAFRRALAELPEIAPPEVASLLSSVHMNDAFLCEGRRLQMKHGLDAVAPRVEQECGAGAWSFMRQGVLNANEYLATLTDLQTIGEVVPSAKAGYAEATGGQGLPFIIHEVAAAIRAGKLVASPAECTACHGSGIEFINGGNGNVLEEPCSNCDGTGKESK